MYRCNYTSIFWFWEFFLLFLHLSFHFWSYHFSCDTRFLHFEAPLALFGHGFARVWLASICTRIGPDICLGRPWHAASLVFAQTFAHLIVQPHKEFETYLSQFLSWIYPVKCNSLMFCLIEHYLLIGTFSHLPEKIWLACYAFVPNARRDRLGETAFCVILWISISLVIHELKWIVLQRSWLSSALFCGPEMN